MQFYVEFRGRAGAWFASILFIFAGAFIAFFVPTLIERGPDRDVVIWLLRILGGALLFIGVPVFLAMLVDVYLAVRKPEYREVWFFWVNLIAGLLGAGLFAIPATFVFPAMLLAYSFQPDLPNRTNNLALGLLFSVIGVICLVAMFLLGRSIYRTRPRVRR